MPFTTFRKASAIDYGRDTEGGLSVAEINCGSLMRIADATEKMCLDREKLERDYQYMRAERDRYRGCAEAAERSNRSLRGVITRMKRAMAQKEAENG